MRRRGTIWLGALSCIAFLAAGCDLATLFASPAPGTPDSVQIGTPVWALGDSQGANSNDPARGLPWTQRIGAVGNGADNMYGAGWTIKGTYSSQTIAERAAALTSANTVREYVVMAGINDLTGGRTVTQMLSGVTAFASQAAAINAKVTWVGVVPLPQAASIANREADRRAFNTALAQRYGANFVDCSSRMSDANGWLKPAYSLGPLDLHLNNAGEQALADCIKAFRG